MKKSGRLQRIANLSTTAEQLAVQAVARATEELDRIDTQVRALESYRDEYLRPLHEPGGQGVGAYQAQKLRLFVGKIQEAMVLLAKKRVMAEHKLAQERNEWMAQKRRAIMTNKVAERARAEEEAVSERALQREIDDRPRRSPSPTGC